MQKLLILMLVASGCAPLYLGVMSFMSYEKVLDILGMTVCPDSFQLTAFAGICMLITAAVQFIAAYWIFKHDKAGIFLSNFIGYAMIFGGIMIFTILHNLEIAGMYSIMGVIILALVTLYKGSRIDENFRTKG